MLKNKHVIGIKIQCSSCRFREIDEAGIRHCKKRGGRVVKPTNCCQRWKMAKGLMNAGSAGGIVRRRGTKEVVID